MSASLGTWLVGLLLLAVVGAIVGKMMADRRKGRGTSCSGDCGRCRGCH